MFSFALPYAIALLLLPFIARYLLKAQQAKTQSALLFPAWLQRNQAEYIEQKLSNKIQPILLWSSYLALVLALMQPTWTGEAIRIKDNGRDILLVIDLSGSMSTEDFVVNGQATDRFSATQKIISQFITKRKGDRIGLILFGDHAYLQSPLSFDLVTVQQFLEEAFIGMAGEKTAIGEAIGLSIKKLSDIDNPQKVVILITDGANTSGIDPIEASLIAKEEKIVIHTIGVGADEMIVRNFFGRQRVNPSRDLDEKTLKTIAKNTDGFYFRARDTEELKDIYQKLDDLNPVRRDELSFRPKSDLFYIPLIACFVLLMLSQLVRSKER